jgi:FAD/FMN-containing dehydrogenase
MNYLGHRLFRQAYPQRQRFLELRRELDPAGLFLNDYSRTCWGSHAGKMVSLLGG